uniref:Uncharacterized protein n=1 Tax=Rhizophora mucronata TaxID=61149 RepID=A0A2P2NV86_RHIMU
MLGERAFVELFICLILCCSESSNVVMWSLT